MIIDRHNYEEFFILYLDNELSDADRRQVETFAQSNPDLQDELNLLLQSKFSPDMDISLDNKEELMKLTVDGMDLTNYEEWLLLYSDNELTVDQRVAVEKYIAANPEIGKELEIFQQAHLIPDQEIVFENKELLYRHETKTRKIGFRTWRVAAAAILLIGLSASVFMLVENKRQADGSSFANNGSSKINTPAITNPAVKENAATDNNPAEPNKENIPNIELTKENLADNITSRPETLHTSKRDVKETSVSVAGDASNNTMARMNHPMPTVNVNEGNEKNNAIQSNINNAIAMRDPLTDSKGNIQSKDVTTENASSSDIRTPDPLTDSDVAGINQSEKKSKFRGFFRKVTRTIEKTTNLKTTDDEDRLLLGGLAIKL